MKIEQLSEHGYKISNVLEDNFFKQVDRLVDTFVPTSIRQTLDRPGLPAPLPTSIREVLLLEDMELKNKLDTCFNQILPKLLKPNFIEFWRDYPGYTNELHYDAEIVKHILILYLGGEGDPTMGTVYYENNKKYFVNYEKNSGLILLNSNKIFHGMAGHVTHDVKYRKLLYANWVNCD